MDIFSLFFNMDVFDVEDHTLFNVSSVLIFAYAVLSSWVNRRYRGDKFIWLTMLFIPISIYVVVLIIWVEFNYYVLASIYMVGYYSTGFLYDLLMRKHYFPPDTDHLDKIDLQLDGANLVMDLYKSNGSDGWRETNLEAFPEKFEKKEGELFASKHYFRRFWKYTDYEQKEVANISLDVFVHEMKGFGDLRNINHLNAAAAAFYFSKYRIPDGADSYSGYDPEVFRSWEVDKLNGCEVIAYEVLKGGDDYKRIYRHYSLSTQLMLTLEVEVIIGVEKLRPPVQEFISQILSGCSLNTTISSAPEQAANIEGQQPVGAPDFDSFLVELPSKDDYRLLLRQHAKDEVEWAVFEKSDLFVGWFAQQYRYVINEFIDLRNQFIEEQLAKCRVD